MQKTPGFPVAGSISIPGTPSSSRPLHGNRFVPSLPKVMKPSGKKSEQKRGMHAGADLGSK